MFDFIKEKYYNTKNVQNLADIIIFGNTNEIINKVFLNKVNEKHNLLKESIDNNNVLEFTKELLNFFSFHKEVNVFKSYISLNKDEIKTFLDKNIDQIDKNKDNFRIKFLNFSVLNNLFENSQITPKIYQLYLNDILKNDKITNIEKIEQSIFLFKEISNKNITKRIFSKDFKKIINDSKEELLNDKNISIKDIKTFENLNFYLYSSNKNISNEYIEQVEVIQFYNKIDFSKIDKKDYINLLKESNIDKNLFDNILKNIEVNKNNVEDVYKTIKSSTYKENYVELLNKLKNNVDTIKKDRNNNILLVTLLIGAVAANNNSSSNSSLLNDVIDIGVDVGVGYGIGTLLD